MKLDKLKFNELLYYIHEDHYKNYLMLKLIYVYGRNASEIFNLQVKDVNVTMDNVTFNIPTGTVTYPLTKDTRDDLIGYIYDQELTDEDYIFRKETEAMEIVIKKLNYYLDRTVESLNKTIEFNCEKLTTKDFKILRGQHLFLDGATLHIIHDLYKNSNIQSTKKNIDYNNLLELKFPCNSLDKIFHEFTDFNLYNDNRFDDTDIFTVGDESENIIIELDYVEQTINLISEENQLTNKIEEIPPNQLCMMLRGMDTGNFRLINGLRFIKN
jgi:hypothetical protein